MRTQVTGARGVGVALRDRRFVLHPERTERGTEPLGMFSDEFQGLLRLFEHASTYGPMLTPLLKAN